MKTEILSILQCPRCSARLEVTPFCIAREEIRSGVLTCKGAAEHIYEIEDGIIKTQAGFDHQAVKREIEYENSTYNGSDRLRDPAIIAQFPDTLADLWPHTCHFGPDFRALIDRLNLPPKAWVLDIGTGPCWSSRILAQRGFKVIALDVNDANFYGLGTADLLFEAHRVFFERILESMTHIPLRNESIDAITFNASFHHTPDIERSVEECFRVLKPGGVAAMVNEEFTSLRQRLFRPEEVTDTGSHHDIAYTEFERVVGAAGFTIEYFVADHVRQQLLKRMPRSFAGAVVSGLERFPLALKQLNSALVLLRKPPGQGAVDPKEAMVARV